MLNNLLSSLFAFFFWGGTTLATKDNIRHASWLKTFTYFVLTIIVALIYAKTLKVETMMTYMDIRDGNSAKVLDGVKIKINTACEGVLNADDSFYGWLKDSILGLRMGAENSYRALLYYDEPFPYNQTGVCIRAYVDYKDSAYFRSFDSSFETYFKGYVDSLSAPPTRPTRQKQNPRVAMITSHRRIHNMLPFTFVKDDQDSLKIVYDATSGEPLYHYIQVVSFENARRLRVFVSDTIRHLWGRHGIAAFSNLQIPQSSHSTASSDMLLDKSYELGYMSAADISQCKYRLYLHSDYPIKKLTVTFNTPVEFMPLPFKVNRMSAYGFEITDSTALAELRGSNTLMYMKFPQMANKQLARSLILTTILTALASLFLYNFYYAVRRLFENEEGEEYHPLTNKRYKITWVLHNVLCITFLLFALYLTYRMYQGRLYYVIPQFLGIKISLGLWVSIAIAYLVFIFVGCEQALSRYVRSGKEPTTDESVKTELVDDLGEGKPS